MVQAIMDKQMKLTDEQREELRNWAEYCKKNSEIARSVLLLFSSEQAWKEEISSLAFKHDQEMIDKGIEISGYQVTIDNLRTQLNQVIEVLKLIANGNNDFPTWADTVDVLIDVRKVARETLSSLSQGTEANGNESGQAYDSQASH